ncbi:hypothetical protein [Methanocalculus sp. MSAO_Arc2]|uniref:hypothetical protein n=1 Tax=Methanocalculus sp. MSAO_Arc2 TaxID=2293855 RepID=UPI0026B7C358
MAENKIRIRRDVFEALSPIYQGIAQILMERGRLELIEDTHHYHPQPAEEASI